MKMKPKTSSFLCGILALMLAAAPQHSNAQGTDLNQLVNNSLTMMEGGKWSDALQLLEKATGLPNSKMIYGSRFGVIWYRKGICFTKLAKYDEAIKCFQTCYRDFAPDEKGGGNVYHKLALLKWGEAAQAAEKYDDAIRQYQAFLAERSKERGKDEYARGGYYVNLAICNFKLGKLPEGSENLEIAIKNRETFPTPDAGIAAGFQGFAGAVIAKRNEQALLDFITKNRADITIEPFEMAEYNPLYLKLAHEAYSAQMERASIALYQMVSNFEVTIEDVQVRLASLGSRKGVVDGSRMVALDKLKLSETNMKKMQQDNKFPECTQLLSMAYIHETNGNPRGAYAAYEIIEQMFPKHAKRENNLFQLVRTSSVIGEVMTTEKYGQVFLTTFPESEHVPAVQRMMLTSLFFEGEYKKCIEVASVVIDKIAKGSDQHDMCLHVLGGSYYFDGQYEVAQPLLDEHSNGYKTSKFRQAALFFQGSNLVKLQDFQKGAVLLDAFLKEFPDADKNPYLSFALFDRANCHYAESEYQPGLAVLNRIEQDFPTTEVLDMAFNLKGNLLLAEKDPKGAEQYYMKGMEVAVKRGNTMVAGEAVYFLISMIGAKDNGKDGNPEIKRAVPWIDTFWKEYATGSPYRTQAAIAGIYAMDAAGRGDEALDRIRDVIAEMASDPSARGLEECINSYTEFYLTKHSPDELKEHYYNFPKIQYKDAVARALLRMAVIGVFEEEIKKAKDEDAKKKAEANVKVLFGELKTAFEVKQLTNYILVRVGDFIREKTASPREALDYYSEALSRKNGGFEMEAMFGRADVLARSTNKADMDGALIDLKSIFEKSEEKKQKEKSLARIVEVYAAKGDWAQCNQAAKQFLAKENNFQALKPKVSFLLAESYEKDGKISDAIFSYSGIWSGNLRGSITQSAPACKRWMELLKERNQPATEKGPADIQGAYDNGYLYIESTRPLLTKMTEAEKVLWTEVEEYVKELEVAPGVKSKAQQKKEKEQK
jgi:tetratricopeptide (TPR) repeat protein